MGGLPPREGSDLKLIDKIGKDFRPLGRPYADKNGMTRRSAASVVEAPVPVFQASTARASMEGAIGELRRSLSGPELSFVLAFVAPHFANDAFAAKLSAAFDGVPVIGCTTAGEIGPNGYEDDSVVALGFAADCFSIRTRLIEPLHGFSLDQGPEIAGEVLSPENAGETALWPSAFALMLVDGMSRQEDALLAAIAPSLGSTPLIGGSAGDRLDFRRSQILTNGRFHSNAAILAHIRTRCPIEIFRFDHFNATPKRMVVTHADPAQRIVHEINAEPAAREYARIVGKDPERLSPFIFAEHPVVVRIGEEQYVRSIQKAEPNGDLRFYCAIDEGLVLTVAESGDMVAELESDLKGLSRHQEPLMILGFDCVLRRLEAEKRQVSRRISELLGRHSVRGFCTYGEQFAAVHVNQTLTGAAIYPPRSV